MLKGDNQRERRNKLIKELENLKCLNKVILKELEP